MTSTVSTPVNRHRKVGHGTPAQPHSQRTDALLLAVPDLFGLLEDGLSFLFLSDIKKV